MRRYRAFLLFFLVLALGAAGCRGPRADTPPQPGVGSPPPARAGKPLWVPGHYDAQGRWQPGHWVYR